MSRPRTNTQTIPMVVNADDFGYFDGVSQGILEAAEAGVVTATGVMANGPALNRWIDKLRGLSDISIGVHLNATLGEPMTPAMKAALKDFGGQFPAKGGLAWLVLIGRLPVETLLEEWRAQITHCIQRGLQIEFINTHEHVHVLPGLHSRVRRLARQLGIRHVRVPRPEWAPFYTPGSLVRNAVFACTDLLPRAIDSSEPHLIGVASSGRLNLEYCRWRFARLEPFGAYELMCHPGRFDQLARASPQLSDYHDWEGELSMLLSPGFADLLSEYGLRCVTYVELNQP